MDNLHIASLQRQERENPSRKANYMRQDTDRDIPPRNIPNATQRTWVILLRLLSEGGFDIFGGSISVDTQDSVKVASCLLSGRHGQGRASFSPGRRRSNSGISHESTDYALLTGDTSAGSESRDFFVTDSGKAQKGRDGKGWNVHHDMIYVYCFILSSCL